MTPTTQIGHRIELTKDFTGLTVVIKAQRKIFLLLFLPVWLTGWALGEVFVAYSLIKGEGSPFLVLWLCGWTVGGAFAITIWLWNAFGKEVITISRGSFTHKRDVFGRGPSKTFPLAELTNLRASGFFGSRSYFGASTAQYGMSGGTVAVDRRGETFRFGYGLGESEANGLVNEMKKYFPQKN